MMEFNVAELVAIFLGIFYLEGNYVIEASSAEDESAGRDVPGRLKLFQYDPVKIGHVRFIEVEPGRYVRMKTLALHPPMFEIPHFLTNEECDTIKTLAIKNGLETSKTAYKSDSTADIQHPHHATLGESYNATFWRENLAACDNDDDSMLDSEEAIGCLPELRRENVTAAMLDMMMGDLDLDPDSDARLDPHELWRIADQQSGVHEDIRTWLDRWRGAGERMVKRWKGRTRVSDQTWLSFNSHDRYPLLKIQDRVVALTRLPPEIVYTSEFMQVVRYRSGGHYHAHYDSDDVNPDLECRHTSISFNLSSGNTFNEERCRFCRMVTVLYYLNDVDGGGETAFPFGDLHYDSQQYQAKLSYDYTDLTDHCHDGNLVVKAERGKAIMWYNHDLDPVTGWLGEKRGHSLHGGCEVTRGVKWIANNWISVDDVYDRQLRYIDSIKPSLRMRAERYNSEATAAAPISYNRCGQSPEAELSVEGQKELTQSKCTQGYIDEA